MDNLQTEIDVPPLASYPPTTVPVCCLTLAIHVGALLLMYGITKRFKCT